MANTWKSFSKFTDVWNEETINKIINNDFVGPATVFTFNTDTQDLKVIKVNSKLLDSVCINMDLDELCKDNSWESFDKLEKTKFELAISRAIKSSHEEECETVRHIKSTCGDDTQYIKSFIHVIGQNENEYLLFTREINVTAEKRAFEEVYESDDKFRHAAEQVNVYAWEYIVKTKEMRPCYRCMRDLGLPAVVKNYPEPAIEMGIFPQDYADMYRDWHKQIENGATFLEADIPLTPGRVPFHVRYTTEFDENGKPYKAYGSATFIQEDVEKTEAIKARELAEKRLEDALLVAEEERQKAAAANDAKTSFLFNMSHDIRTPMNAIIGFTNLLGDNLDNKEKREDYLEKINESSSVLLSLINNVLEMARIERGNIALEEKTINLSDFFKSTYIVFNDLMDQKNLKFTHNLDVKHKYVLADEIKLREVIINLISNSYKYTRNGGSVDFSIKEETKSSDISRFTIIVKDTGVGMSKEFIPHIFEEFSRELTSTDAKVEGTGLGMPIVKRYLDMMNGNITIDSELCVGTTFTITLDLKLAEEPEVVETNVNEISTDSLRGRRLLLAEDNDLNAEIAIAILEEEGLIIERAENGKVCLDMLIDAADDYYDAILMDIQMPLMNGFIATKHIRSLTNTAKANIPIIAMTANAFEEDRKKSLDAGMNAHLAKPIVVAELMNALLEFIK